MNKWISILIIFYLATSVNISAEMLLGKFPTKKKSKVTFGAGVQYLFSKTDGEGKYTSLSTPGSDMTFDDLGLKGKENILFYNIHFGTIRHQIKVEYSQFKRNGNKALTKNLTLDATNYIASEQLRTDFETTWGRAYYQFWDQRSNLSMSYMLGIEYYSFDYDIKSALSGGRKSIDQNVFLPVIGTQLIYGSSAYYVQASAFYLPKFFGINDGDVIDVNASVQFRFGSYLRIEGGYRYIDSLIEGSSGDKQTGLKIKGFFVSLGIVY